MHSASAYSRIFAMALAVGFLFVFTNVVSALPCWALFIVVALLAWPIWRYRVDYLLFRRRLVLAGLAPPEGRVRTWLWKGNITKGMQVVISLVLAWILLVLIFQLSLEHRYVLAADAVFLGLVAGVATRWLTGEIKPEHRGIIARRWLLFLVNGIMLSGAIMALDFSVVGAPDTRHLEWHQVAEQAFARSSTGASCLLWGTSAGVMAVIEALSWHGSELVIPNLPDVTARVIAWTFFLLRAATVAWLFTSLLLGVSVLLERRKATPDGHTPESTVSRVFFLTIIILALPYFYAASRLSEVDYSVLEKGVSNMARIIDPCKPDKASRERLVTRLDTEVDQRRGRAVRDIDRGVDAGMDAIFSDVQQGVDGYLDWYFTVIGEYQRLAVAFTEDATAVMRRKVEEYLFAQADFDRRLEHLDRVVEQKADERFADLVPHIQAELDNPPCGTGAIDVTPLMDLDHDKLRASTAATTGVGAGVVASKVLAKKTTAAVVGKVAAKKSVQAGTTVASKALAKKGASSLLAAGTGTTMCAPTGPVAILCGVTAGLVTWFTVDKALVELDEAFNRDEMREEILKAIADQKVALGTELKDRHFARVDQIAARLNTAVQNVFVPARDGVGYSPRMPGDAIE